MDTLLNIGIDIGGTFTDFVVHNVRTGSITTFKILSTPQDASQAFIQGLNQIGLHSVINRIVHGSTVATNALIERKGAPTALVTTQGFRDVLQIGRQNRPSLYQLKVVPIAPLVDTAHRFEIQERIDHNGSIIQRLEDQSIDSLLDQLKTSDANSVAVCLLFSFLHPEHEQRIGARLLAAGYSVSLSHEVSPEFREYERTSTTVINAYVTPILDQYLQKLANSVTGPADSHPVPIQIMQSNGGIISIDEARQQGVRCILSGPAGGVIGSCHVAKSALVSVPSTEAPVALRLITFDMGGTSTDVSVVDSAPLLTTEATIGGFPIRIPLIDIHTIGAGGGSIGWVDLGGALRVGPQSAGAYPGPACYGRIDPDRSPELLLPTVTDANLILGRLLPDYFLGGSFQLQPELAQRAVEKLSDQRSISPVQAALGIIAVADAHMERALRLVSIEKGHDPRLFTLVAFGGAGGLHASNLARRLGILRVLIPPYASTLSALGMLSADIEKDFSQTIMVPGDALSGEIDRRLEPLLNMGMNGLIKEGVSPGDITLLTSLDIRYKGQSYELQVPWPPSGLGLAADFSAAHQKAFGYSNPSGVMEIVNIRVRAQGKVKPVTLREYPPGGPESSQAAIGSNVVVLGNFDQQVSTEQVPCYKGERLLPQNEITGPALILRDDTTILLQPGDQAVVDSLLNLWIHTPDKSVNRSLEIQD